jgi:integrase
VSWLVRRYVAGRTDITLKSREQYEWAIPHIENGLGAIQLSLLDRDDVATWISNLAEGGKLSRRRRQICRNVLRASLREAVDEGLIPRSPAARVGLPRTVAKPERVKETEAWTAAEVDRFIETSSSHRWAVGFRLGVLYGLRRSEILALRWDDLDTKAGTLRIDESLVATRTGAAWSNAKNERSRGSSHSTTTHFESSPGVEQRRQRSGSQPARNGRTRPDHRHAHRVGSCCLARTTVRSQRSWRPPSSRASPRTGCATPRRPTWCKVRPISASFGRSPTCSATAPRC